MRVSVPFYLRWVRDFIKVPRYSKRRPISGLNQSLHKFSLGRECANDISKTSLAGSGIVEHVVESAKSLTRGKYISILNKSYKRECANYTLEIIIDPQQNFRHNNLGQGLGRGSSEPWDPGCSQKTSHSAEQQQVDLFLKHLPWTKYSAGENEDAGGIHRPGSSGAIGNWHPLARKTSSKWWHWWYKEPPSTEGKQLLCQEGKEGQRHPCRWGQSWLWRIEFDAEHRGGWPHQAEWGCTSHEEGMCSLRETCMVGVAGVQGWWRGGSSRNGDLAKLHWPNFPLGHSYCARASRKLGRHSVTVDKRHLLDKFLLICLQIRLTNVAQTWMDASRIRWIKASIEPLYQEVCADQLTGLNPELGAGLHP